MTEETALYRHFDANGKLLYVGVSNDPIRRLSEHEKTKDWKTEIRDIKIEYFETREIALLAEQLAIKVEKPIHNVVHNNVSRKKVNNFEHSYFNYEKEAHERKKEEWGEAQEYIKKHRNKLAELSDYGKWQQRDLKPNEELIKKVAENGELNAIIILKREIVDIGCDKTLLKIKRVAKFVLKEWAMTDTLYSDAYVYDLATSTSTSLIHSQEDFLISLSSHEGGALARGELLRRETEEKLDRLSQEQRHIVLSEYRNCKNPKDLIPATPENLEKYGWFFDKSMRNGLGGWNNVNRKQTNDN